LPCVFLVLVSRLDRKVLEPGPDLFHTPLILSVKTKGEQRQTIRGVEGWSGKTATPERRV